MTVLGCGEMGSASSQTLRLAAVDIKHVYFDSNLPFKEKSAEDFETLVYC